MTPDQLKIFEEKLTEAVDKFIANGGEVCSGSFREGDKRCPVECLTQYIERDLTGDPGYSGFLSQAMGFEVTSSEMWSFINAFDDRGSDLGLVAPSSVGKRLRQKYIEKQ